MSIADGTYDCVVQCQGSYIFWNTNRQSPLSPEEFGRRLTKAVTLAGERDIILIRDQPIAVLDLNTERAKPFCKAKDTKGEQLRTKYLPKHLR